ncbi:hypothetical protein [Thermoactinomyces sp. CICC 10522]|uniref:hypothetical protein n=1 Tax=Thermoactinomyces sp. CICC 10522 TaxID=2767427 RepID=UPI0018DDC9AD|nr:hypothetical protein [Thermoactinomyces sp. CICC 10522]MBH8605614.1 hypothetical protein [Thermoactinomyces sp. CICC 10522]
MADKGRVMKRKNPFIMIDRKPIEDPQLSWKATGLMTYFVGKPDGWEFRMDHIIKSKTDGEKSVRSGINELKEAGYIVRVAFRKDGKVKDYEFFVYEEPVKYPTTKDLHIDLDLWEKYMADHQEDDLIDVTVAALEIKEMKEQMKQVSQNRQPEKNQGFEQVSQNGKPESFQCSEQVSGFQHPAFQHPENAGLSIGTLSISNQNKNYDDDAQYLQLRILFMNAGGQDIKKHDQHYQTYLNALAEIGSFEKMKELASKYIVAVKENNYHESPQIVWFISDGWRNFVATKVKKMTRRYKSDSDLPEMLKLQLEGGQQQEPIDPQEQERKVAELKAKIERMNKSSKPKTPVI